MPHQIQLTYTATAVNNTTTAALSAAMAAVVLYTSAMADPVLCQGFGLTVASDTMSTVGSAVTRTILLNMDPGAPSGPKAPALFTIHTQTVDAPGVIWSSSDQDSAAGIGAQQVRIQFGDAEGNEITENVTLNGRTPVAIPTVGANGIIRVDALTIIATGALGNSLGQITVAQTGPAAAQTRDALQDAIGQKLAYLPPSFYSLATAPGATIPSPSNLQALVSNLFTNALTLALSTAVTAGTPVLI